MFSHRVKAATLLFSCLEFQTPTCRPTSGYLYSGLGRIHPPQLTMIRPVLQRFWRAEFHGLALGNPFAPPNSFFFGGVIVLLVLAHWLDNCHALAGRDDICQRLKSGSHYKGKHEAS